MKLTCATYMRIWPLPDDLCLDGKKERKKKGSYWENTISRRVQHFGYRFNYETLSLDSPRDMCPLPPFFTDLMESKLHREAKQEEQPNRKEQKPEKEQTQEQKSPEEEHGGEGEEGIMTQMTINEYYPGQGISSHIGKEAHTTHSL